MTTIRSLSSKEVAVPLGLKPPTIQKYARDGRIPFSQTPGGHRRFSLEEVRDALAADQTAMLLRPPLPVGGSLEATHPGTGGRGEGSQIEETLRATVTPSEDSDTSEDALSTLFRHARRVLVSH